MSKPIKIGTDIFCPYVCNKEAKGLLKDKLIQISQKSELDISYQVAPWSRILEDYSNKKIDILAPVLKAYYPKGRFSKKPIFKSRICLVTTKKALELEDDELRMVVPKDYKRDQLPFYDEDFKLFLNIVLNGNVFYLSGLDPTTRSLKMMEKGRVNATILDERQAKFFLKDMQSLHIKKCFNEKIDYYILFSSRVDQKTINQINNNL